MSNTTYASASFKTATPASTTLLRELFQATPLYIIVSAAMAAVGQSARR